VHLAVPLVEIEGFNDDYNDDDNKDAEWPANILQGLNPKRSRCFHIFHYTYVLRTIKIDNKGEKDKCVV